MNKVLINLRIEKDLKSQLDHLSTYRNETLTSMVRDKLKELVANGHDAETKLRVAQICRELRQPFVYIRPLRSQALDQRKNRNELAKKLEEVFL